MTNSRFPKWLIAPVASGVAGAALILLNTSVYGAGTNADSVNYIAAARSFTAGKGLVCSDLEPFIAWPPLFPFLLALIEIITDVDPLQSVRWVNAFCFGMVILLSGFWIHQRTESGWAAAAGSLSVLVAFPLLYVFRMAYSEPLFILFTLGFLMEAERVTGERGIRRLLYFSVLAGAAFLTRYLGVSLILTGIALILARPKLTVRERARSTFIFILVSSVPVAIWIVRNYLLSGTFSGHQYPISSTPWFNFIQTVSALSKWFLPGDVPGAARVLLSGAVMSVPAIILFYIAAREDTGERDLFFKTFLPIAFFLSIYTGLLILTRSNLIFHLIGHRYLAPLYVPLAVYFIAFGYQAASFLERRRPLVRARLIFLLMAGAWLCYPGFYAVKNSLKYQQNGAGGYANPRWQNSETARWLRDNPPSGPVFSNDPQAAYILGLVHARWSAYKHPYNAPSGQDNLSWFLEVSEEGWLAWFDYPARRFYTVDELREFVEIEPVANLSDGAVYKIGRSGH